MSWKVQKLPRVNGASSTQTTLSTAAKELWKHSILSFISQVQLSSPNSRVEDILV
jgi:hypothetical protein